MEQNTHIAMHNRRLRAIIRAVIIVLLVGVVLVYVVPVTQGGLFSDIRQGILNDLNFSDGLSKIGSQSNTSLLPNNNISELDAHDRAITAVVEKADPAVVAIAITKDVPVLERCPVNNPFSDLPQEFQQFFGGTAPQFYGRCQKGTQKQEVGGGSGFLVSSDGYIVTNKHVVNDAKAEYTVLTNSGKKYTATVVARHPTLDVAIVKIKGSNFPTVQLGNSDTIKLGQTAIAIGNALGEFRNTVSVGVVSGLARSVTASDGSGGNAETIDNVIQIDAAINPGNSGGPLLDINGNVIGMNTAMVSGAQSIGFAIPVNAIRKSVESVARDGTIKAAYLGVRYVMLTEDVAKKYSLPITEGAFVKGDAESLAVEPSSPASKADIREGDVIIAIDGKKITTETSLASIIAQKNPGDMVQLDIQRGDKKIQIRVELGERKN